MDKVVERLIETARRISTSLELDQTLTAIIEDATSLLEAASGDMLLWDRERDVLRVVAVSRFPPDMVGYEMRFGEGLSSQAIRARRTIQVDDYATSPRRAPHLEQYEFGAVICAPLLFRGTAIGTINVHAPGKGRRFSSDDAELLGAFADLAAIAVDHARRYEDLEQRIRGDVIGELLTGAYASEAAITGRIGRLGHDPAAWRDLLVLTVADREGTAESANERTGRIVRRIGEFLLREVPRGAVADVGGDLVVLVPERRPRHLATTESVAEALRRTVRDTLPDAEVSVAIGDPCTRVADFAESFRLAREALEVMRRLGRRDVVIGTRELGAYRLLLTSNEPQELRAFATRTLGPLVEYDRRTGTDLLETLRTYLDEDRNHRRAAARLVIHINTVAYRVGRIEELLGRDLSDPSVIFELTLALRIDALSPVAALSPA